MLNVVRCWNFNVCVGIGIGVLVGFSVALWILVELWETLVLWGLWESGEVDSLRKKNFQNFLKILKTTPTKV